MRLKVPPTYNTFGTFRHYDGWENDVRTVATYSTFGVANDAAERLLEAFKPPECGKQLCSENGSRIDYLKKAEEPAQGFVYFPILCKLPKGHEGDHVPNVHEEAWR